jgi:hypothetical protein
VSSVEPDRNGSEINGGQKIAGGLVVSGGNGTELFQVAEEVLDPVACLVEVFIIVSLDFAIRLGRNHRGFSGLRQRLEHPLVGIVALIGNDDRRFQAGQQGIGPFQITGLSGRQQEAGRFAQGIDGGMNLRAPSALAPSEGLAFALFF